MSTLKRKATAEEKKAIEPGHECKRVFPDALDIWVDHFVMTNCILDDPWEDGPSIQEQIHDRLLKAREKYFSQRDVGFLQNQLVIYQQKFVSGDEKRKDVDSLLEALRKALRDKGHGD